MNQLKARIEQRFRQDVCPLCRQERPVQQCEVKGDHCPLMVRIDDLIEVVAGIRDFSLEPYLQEVREEICATCRADADGHCKRRQKHECSLNNYFPRVIAIVEQEFQADKTFA